MAAPEVHLSPSTCLRGREVRSAGAGTCYAFLGVPYARPPTGPLRFQPPQPLPLWQGTRNARHFGHICPQSRVLSERVYRPDPVPVMAEDCLFLNVWTPGLTPGTRRPTMVWIHGGGFNMGFSDRFPGTELVCRKNVVFVSFNYRLGIFGFLSTSDGHIKGNMGFLDQVEVLKWVQTHISKFGGDPDNVTVFGESAGGISVALLQVSPLCRGLYRRAILQSGALHPVTVWPRINAHKFLTKRLKQIGCTATSGADIVDFLQTLPLEALVSGSMADPFPNVVDGVFLPDDPLRLYRQGLFHPVDLMIGFNKHDGFELVQHFFFDKEQLTTEQTQNIVGHIVQEFYRGHPKSPEISSAVHDLYVTRVLEKNPAANLKEVMTEIYGDLLFAAPSLQIANWHSARARVYVYHFLSRSPWSRRPLWVDADHGDELPHVFGWVHYKEAPRGSTPHPGHGADHGRTPPLHRVQKLTDDVMEYWTQFASNGCPSSSWPAYEQTRRYYQQIDEESRTQADFKPDKLHLWNHVVPGILSENLAKV